jgi:hypothetical protein
MRKACFWQVSKRGTPLDLGLIWRGVTEEDKTFRQITPVGKDRFYFEGPKEKWPLYKIQDIQAGTVILVEGEQCADLLREMV